MAEIKTKATDADVSVFLESVEDPQKRADSLVILDMLKDITGYEPVMWEIPWSVLTDLNTRIPKGRKNFWPVIGFSPRKQNLTLYIHAGFGGSEASWKTGETIPSARAAFTSNGWQTWMSVS